MTNFESEYFTKFNFTKGQLNQYHQSAKSDLDIAKNSDVPEVILKFTYDALIKLGIALIAGQGFKIRSIPGHHIKIIEKLSEVLDDKDIEIYGSQIREIRNLDLYEGGYAITEKEAKDFLEFTKKIFKKPSKLINT